MVDLSFEPFREAVANADERLVDDVFRFVTKVQSMTWANVFATSSKGSRKRGINWEPLAQTTRSGKRVASVRINQKCRARAIRKGAVMRLISLHPDHDSAYDASGGDPI